MQSKITVSTGSYNLTAVCTATPVVLSVVISALMCGCFWTWVCLQCRRQARAHGNQSVRTRPRPYLNTSTTPVQQQAQHDTSGTPAGYQYHPDDTTRAQPDLSNSTLQDAPPPPYEVAKNYSPPSYSAVFISAAPQPFPPQFSDLAPENPPQYPGVS